MKTLYLCLFALTLCASEPDSTIRGVVLDPSNRPVEGARVQCGTQTVFSGAEGRFHAAGPGCDAKVTKGGFEPLTQKLSAGTETRLKLAVQGPAERVLVTATRTSATPEEASVAASLIDSGKIQASNYATIPDLLRDLPATAVVAAGRRGNQTSIFTRGASSTSTLVLIDGVPVNDPGGQINLAHLSSAGVDHVESVRGPESALFGAEASAGAIQIFTQRGDAEARMPRGFVSYERGNFQTDRWVTNLNGGLLNRLDYSLTADQFHSAGAFPNDFYRNTTGSANVGYRISDRTQVRGIFRTYDAHLGTPGQVAYKAYDVFANEETRDTTIAARVDDTRGSRYFQTFSFGYHRLHDLFNENEPYSSQNLAALVRDVPAGQFTNTYFVSLLDPKALPATIPAGQRLVKATAYFGPYGSLAVTERKSADYQGTVSETNGATVFGYSFQEQSGLISESNVSRDHNSFFVNQQYRVGPRLSLSGGFRVEHSSAFGTEFVPRGGASLLLFREHGPLSSASLRFSAGRGVVEPSLYENYVQSPYAKGNPNLKPEKTNTYELALAQEWFGRRLRTEVGAFRSSFENLITYVYPSWQNIEKSWGRGVEFSADARLMRYVRLSGNYTLLYTRVVNSVSPKSATTGIGQELLRRPRNSGSVAVSVTPRRWSFLMGARMVGERHDSDFTFGLTRAPAYQNVYLSGSYTLSRHFTPFLRMDNLLDQRYEEALGYTSLSRSVIGGLRIGW